MKVDVLLGLQWGDEGKGKVVDVLTPRYDVVARFQGGPNAGHTLEFEGKKYVLRSIPSGIFQHGQVNIIGNGVVLDPVLFREEAEDLEKSGVDIKKILKISKKAHLIMPTHRLLDAANEKLKGSSKIGTTGKGIGPTYTDKVSRNGLRVGDIFHNFEEKYAAAKARHVKMLEMLDAISDFSELEAKWLDAINYLKQYELIDSEHYIFHNEAVRTVFEGAGALLRGDLDFISEKYNKPIPAEEAILIALISGSDVLQAEAEREERVNMCTALERLAEENRQRGIEQGIAQGRCEERDVTVKALLLQGLLPEQKIAEAVNISMEQLQEIKEQVPRGKA